MDDFFGNFFSILWFSLWFTIVIAFWFLVIRIILDIFRDPSLGGGAKTLWVIVVILFPALGALIYLLTRGEGMYKRDATQAKAMREAQVEYTKGLVAEASGPAGEIKAAKDLLDSGAITQAEFDTLKAKALQ